MSIRVLIVLAFGLTLAACATAPMNTLSQDTRDSLRIDSIDVSFAKDAAIQLGDAERAAPEEPAARTAFLEQKAIGPIKAALNAEILPAFRGTAPAKLKVRIRGVRVPALGTTIILANIPYVIIADMDLVDSRTGKTLLSASNFNALAQTYGGVLGIIQAAASDEPIVRASKAFAHVLSIWLKTGQKLAAG
jgi:hypothetical protein